MTRDSTDRIYAEITETPFDLNLREGLHRLAQLEPSINAPYLTVTLDWRPQGSRPDVREGRRYFTNQSDALLKGLQAHTPEHDSLSADVAKIGQYLDSDISPEAQSVLFVACNARGVFEVFELAVPVEHSMTVAPTPELARLSWLVDDFRAYAVLLADQKNASLSIVAQSKRVASLHLEGDDYPRRTSQGGFSQLRFQNNVNERIEGFASDVAAQTRATLEGMNIDMLVLAADEVVGSALQREFHPTVAEKIVGTISLDIRASEQDIIAAAAPVIEAAERQLEADAVQRVQDNLGTGEYAVAGPEAVLTALQTGQVQTLIMTDDFNADGWADYTLPVYGAGSKPRRHPAGGDVDQIVDVSLPGELVRLAIQTDADVEIVSTTPPNNPGEDADGGRSIPKAGDEPARPEAAQALDALGGVAALLRFPLAIDQTTAEM